MTDKQVALLAAAVYWAPEHGGSVEDILGAAGRFQDWLESDG